MTSDAQDQRVGYRRCCFQDCGVGALVSIVLEKLSGFISSFNAVAGSSRSGVFSSDIAEVRFTRCRFVRDMFTDVRAITEKRTALTMLGKDRNRQKPALLLPLSGLPTQPSRETYPCARSGSPHPLALAPSAKPRTRRPFRTMGHNRHAPPRPAVVDPARPPASSAETGPEPP